ncbi:MAG: pyridoxamine 5'-phosphate oxidase family protein [Lachnospiraceae bacterium]|nr:pyridoxamine 5'-phosphate oxidase family protein [Lachnospiraceae bacterium]
MRRSDRELKDREQMIEVMKKCDVCRLALNDEGYPYILPLNFGMEEKEGQVILYFHGAAEGKKYELIEKDNRASFEMDCSHELATTYGKDGCSCTMKYESVVGRGRIELVSAQEKYDALRILMGHYHEEECAFNQAVMSHTTVFKLMVEQMSGKAR